MPAPFAVSLCGYRDGNPNTSDASDTLSRNLGREFFEVMGITPDVKPPNGAIGNVMATELTKDLRIHLKPHSPHLDVQPERALNGFEQYSHLNAARELAGDLTAEVRKAIGHLERITGKLDIGVAGKEKIDNQVQKVRDELLVAESKRQDLLNLMGDESLLKLDVTVSREIPNPITPSLALRHLIAGLSLKWSLRTDRAQDCRSQGAKMAALRRGRMPHFAAVTMEPRPSMLAILGRGSGDLDCVYHLHLPALSSAIDEYCSGTNRQRLSIRDNFYRLRDQRRVRDYNELLDYLKTL